MKLIIILLWYFIVSYTSYVLDTPQFVDRINTQVHKSTKHTPYELVFRQPPRSLLVPDATLRGQLDEEALQCVNTLYLHK